MDIIRDKEFGGERPLYAVRNLRLENVVVHAGESALKNTANIEADGCVFEGKYPFWHTDGFRINRCLFKPGARAALWYSRNLVMTDTQVDAPKMFREMDGIVLRGVNIPDGQETLWHCANVDIRDVRIEKADYLFMHSHDIKIEDYYQQGNYSFQYCRNVEIRNARIDSRDAFWGTENVTVCDSELNGEYLGWHSRRLRLVRCRISGTQPLCYCRDLVMEDCVFDPSCDLAFEDSEVKATILSPVTSIKDPLKADIKCQGVGELIEDCNSKALEGDVVIVDDYGV